MPTALNALFSQLNATSFASIDTEIEVKLSKLMPGSPRGKAAIPNPHFGRIKKVTSGSQIIVSTNKNFSTYVSMIRKRLEKEGKNPDSFETSGRVWGERIPKTPMIKKINGDGSVSYYLEAIFQKAGTSAYFLDGERIAKEYIIGLSAPSVNESAQGGLEDQVVIRSFKLESIIAIRAMGLDTNGPYTFKE